MKRVISLFRNSALELKNLQCVLVTGLMIALSMVIESRTIQLGFAKINFAFLAIAVIGMLYGPSVGFCAGALCDIIGYIVAPDGGFIPLYVLIGAVQGLLYGLITYHKTLHKPLNINWRGETHDVSLPVRLVLARVLDVVFINILCNTAANYHYGFLVGSSSLTAAIVARIAKNLLELPIDCALILIILPAVYKAYQIVFGKQKVVA